MESTPFGDKVYCEFVFSPSQNEIWDALRICKSIDKIKSVYSQGTLLHIRKGNARSSETDDHPDSDDSDIVFRFCAPNDDSFLQIGENLLIVNPLRPYCGWEKFPLNIVKATEFYYKVWQPQKITQAILHYVKRVSIPNADF